jgi:hypothetical protein
MPALFLPILYSIYILAAFFIPVFFLFAFVRVWLQYVRAHFILKNPGVLLELKLPKDITKSPAAMEVFFTALFQTGAASHLETYWSGKVRPVFSLEMVSIEGKVRFFIYCRKAFRNIVESQIYAQYPTVEIHEVPDYTDLVEHNQDNLVMWGTYFIKKEDQVYPIKTYVDYGMEAPIKEEYQIDPMTSVLEYLGSLREGEYAWIQILIRAHKSEGFQEGRFLQEKKEKWNKDVKAAIKKIKEGSKSGDEEKGSFQRLTKAEQETITSMERNLSKFPFDCVIRAFYIAKEDIFNGNLGITGLIGSFRQYSSAHMNNIGLGWFTDHEDFGKDMLTLFGWFPPFRNMMRRRRDKMEQSMLQSYKDRVAFDSPFMPAHLPFIFTKDDPKKYLPFVMTTEELATIFHFPGNVAATPTFDRILAKKAEAPSNLPI